MRSRIPRIRLRAMLAAVAALAVALSLVVEWSGFRQRRARSLAFAKLYREYEARVRFDVDRFESCAAEHANAGPGSCATCGVRWDSIRTFDGILVRSAAEAAATLRQAAELFARRAERNERAASALWSRPSAIAPAELDAWRILQSGHGPVSEKFFTVF